MSETHEAIPNESNLFDLDSLDQYDSEAARRALVNEYGRIALLAPRILPLLGFIYEAPHTGTETDKAQYDYNIAEDLDELACYLSTPQHLEELHRPTTGEQARLRVFLNNFHHLSSSASAEDLTNAIEARRQYMTALRVANTYGISLHEYQTMQQAAVLDEASIDLATQDDKAAFVQLLLLQQQYQAGERNG